MMGDLTADFSIAAIAELVKTIEAKLSVAKAKPTTTLSKDTDERIGPKSGIAKRDTTEPPADAAAKKPNTTSSHDLPRPLNLTVAEFCRQVGVKKTRGYKLLADHQVVIIRLGVKSLIPATELDRVQAALLKAAAPVGPTEKARVMATASVKSREAKPPP